MSVRFIAGAIVTTCAVIAAVALYVSDSRAIQIVSGVVIVAAMLVSFTFDWIEAKLNEEHVDANPHLLKNNPIGETVRAVNDFVVDGEISTGFVSLNGEKWRARCSFGRPPRQGESMVVKTRDGLTLDVESGGR